MVVSRAKLPTVYCRPDYSVLRRSPTDNVDLDYLDNCRFEMNRLYIGQSIGRMKQRGFKDSKFLILKKCQKFIYS